MSSGSQRPSRAAARGKTAAEPTSSAAAAEPASADDPTPEAGETLPAGGDVFDPEPGATLDEDETGDPGAADGSRRSDDVDGDEDRDRHRTRRLLGQVEVNLRDLGEAVRGIDRVDLAPLIGSLDDGFDRVATALNDTLGPPVGTNPDEVTALIDQTLTTWEEVAKQFAAVGALRDEFDPYPALRPFYLSLGQLKTEIDQERLWLASQKRRVTVDSADRIWRGVTDLRDRLAAGTPSRLRALAATARVNDEDFFNPQVPWNDVASWLETLAQGVAEAFQPAPDAVASDLPARAEAIADGWQATTGAGTGMRTRV